MENTNVNPNQETPQGGGFDDVMTMFADYKAKSETNKNTKVSVLTKMFTPRNSIENFRILPPKPGRKIIEEAYFHKVQVNDPSRSDGKRYRTIFCSAKNSAKVPKLDAQGQPILKQNGEPVLVNARCPLCEKAEAIKKNLDVSIKYIKKENMDAEQLAIREKNSEIYREAGKWEARMYYLVRGIDKGMPKDGVKFWRFKENFKKQGIYEKLVPALGLFHEEYNVKPYDVIQGTDLYINVVDSKMPNGNTFKDVSSITAKKPSKLYDDDIVVKQWLSDDITWRDVFKEASMTRVLNSTEYLERVIMGTDPYWDESDKDNKRYVFPNPLDAELMVKANTRTDSLDADDSSDNDEMASDLAANVVGQSYNNVNISNVTKEDVGTNTDNAVNVGAEFTSQAEPQVDNSTDDEYDDLPF